MHYDIHVHLFFSFKIVCLFFLDLWARNIIWLKFVKEEAVPTLFSVIRRLVQFLYGPPWYTMKATVYLLGTYYIYMHILYQTYFFPTVALQLHKNRNSCNLADVCNLTTRTRENFYSTHAHSLLLNLCLLFFYLSISLQKMKPYRHIIFCNHEINSYVILHYIE